MKKINALLTILLTSIYLFMIGWVSLLPGLDDSGASNNWEAFIYGICNAVFLFLTFPSFWIAEVFDLDESFAIPIVGGNMLLHSIWIYLLANFISNKANFHQKNLTQ